MINILSCCSFNNCTFFTSNFPINSFIKIIKKIIFNNIFLDVNSLTAVSKLFTSSKNVYDSGKLKDFIIFFNYSMVLDS